MRFSNWLQFPRMPFSPRKRLPNVEPRPPTLEKLKEAILSPIKYPTFPPRSQALPHIRLAKPKQQQRHLTDVETARPLPTTFSKGETMLDFKTKPLIPEPLPKGDYHYPFRYYEITLRRGVTGLPARTRHIVQSIGLLKRHQVVWRLVSPRSAGQLLKIKELVHVRLVNEIPKKEPYPTGYKKVSNLLI